MEDTHSSILLPAKQLMGGSRPSFSETPMEEGGKEREGRRAHHTHLLPTVRIPVTLAGPAVSGLSMDRLVMF